MLGQATEQSGVRLAADPLVAADPLRQAHHRSVPQALGQPGLQQRGLAPARDRDHRHEVAGGQAGQQLAGRVLPAVVVVDVLLGERFQAAVGARSGKPQLRAEVPDDLRRHANGGSTQPLGAIFAEDAFDHADNHAQLRVPDRRAAETQRRLLAAQGQLVIAVGGGDTVESEFSRQPGLRSHLRVAEGAQARLRGARRPAEPKHHCLGWNQGGEPQHGHVRRILEQLDGSRQRPAAGMRLDADGGAGCAAGQHVGAGHDQAAGRHEEARAGLFGADDPHHPGGGQLRGKLVHIAPLRPRR